MSCAVHPLLVLTCPVTQCVWRLSSYYVALHSHCCLTFYSVIMLHLFVALLMSIWRVFSWVHGWFFHKSFMTCLGYMPRRGYILGQEDLKKGGEISEQENHPCILRMSPNFICIHMEGIKIFCFWRFCLITVKPLCWFIYLSVVHEDSACSTLEQISAFNNFSFIHSEACVELAYFCFNFVSSYIHNDSVRFF